MKRLTTAFVLALFIATTAATSMVLIGAGQTSVTGAGTAGFPSGTVFNGVTLTRSQFGKGVVLNPDGSATGDFYNVLDGSTAVGPRTITVTGLVSSGSLNPNGSVTFGGNCSLDMGDGSPPTSVPFSVTATSQGLTLVIGTTTLPTQTVIAGAIDIR
jgi:hypothetical protein